MTFKKVEKLIYRIQRILDKIEKKETSGTRNVYKTNLGEIYYQQKAKDIYKLVQKLELASKVIPETIPVRQSLDKFHIKYHSADTILQILLTERAKLIVDLNIIKYNIPNRSLNSFPNHTTGEIIALILLAAIFFLLIPGGLVYWAIAGKTILPVILLTIYLALVWFVAKFLKGLRNAFRR